MRRFLALFAVLTYVALVPAPLAGVSSSIVISQVYGGGGNAGATFKNDFIELFNRGGAPISLSGWSVQYAPAAGAGTTFAVTSLTDVTLARGQYYLVQEAQGTGGTVSLPLPDAVLVDGADHEREGADGHSRRRRREHEDAFRGVRIGVVVRFEVLDEEAVRPHARHHALGRDVDAADNVNEHDERFFVNLSAATGAFIADNQGIGTVVNDDPAPALSINDVIVREGNSGTTGATFTVTLSGPGADAVTVNFSTADGTAAAGSDYQARSGTLTFSAGETSQTVTVLVNGDTINEPDEIFAVNLASAVNASILDAQGIATMGRERHAARRHAARHV